jgi:hypothetical protein
MHNSDSQHQYIFTVTAGRSGQALLTNLLRQHVPGCFPAFEKPSINRHLPGFLGDMERQFRRRFVETHELLGRGQVLTAFDQGDDAYLEKIARQHLSLIAYFMANANTNFRAGPHPWLEITALMGTSA